MGDKAAVRSGESVIGAVWCEQDQCQHDVNTGMVNPQPYFL
jgi:hypothetical protein